MNRLILILALCTLPLQAQTPAEIPKSPGVLHREGADQLVLEQDELSADVQQLVIEQTHPQVIALLGEVEDIMDEATERLIEADTGGETIAAQTEIIEKIHAAAKAKQSQSGSRAGGAMMDMMERMMGKTPSGDGPPNGQGQQAGDSAGQGQTGDSDTLNTRPGGDPESKQGVRRVPKSSGTSGQTIPQEFRNAFDAYNRGAEETIK